MFIYRYYKCFGNYNESNFKNEIQNQLETDKRCIDWARPSMMRTTEKSQYESGFKLVFIYL